MASLIENAQTDRRRKFLIDVAYLLVIIAIFILFLKYAFYPLLPIEIAIIVALILHKPVEKLASKAKIPKGITATVIVILALALICAGIYFLVIKVAQEIAVFVQFIQVKLQDFDWINTTVYTIVGALPKFLQKEILPTIDDVMNQLKLAMENDAATGVTKVTLSAIDFSSISDSISGIGSGIGSGVLATAKQIPSFLVGFLICIVLCCFMTIEFEQIDSFIVSHLPGGENNIVSATRRVLGQSVGKLAKAYALICCITFVEMLIGLTILRVAGIFHSSYIFAISICTALFDILPVMGLGMVLIPWAIYCIIAGNYKLAIGLAIMYIIMTVIRHIIEPKLVSGAMSLPSALTLSVMYIGLKAFGAIGMFAFVIALYCVVAMEKEGIIHLFPKIADDEIPPVEKVEEVGE